MLGTEIGMIQKRWWANQEELTLTLTLTLTRLKLNDADKNVGKLLGTEIGTIQRRLRGLQ